MQLSLVVALIPIVNILLCGASADSCILADLFLGFGYSRECVVSSLATIVLRNKVPTTNEPSLAEDLVLKVKNSTNTLTEVQTLLQENVTSILTEVKTLLQVVKSELKNVSHFQLEIKTLLQEVKTEQQNEKKKSDRFEALINSKLKNCAELRVLLGDEFSGGVQTVYPYGFTSQATVFCDQVTDGGGWTVIQSRSPLPIRENFQRNWTDYVKGFGDLTGEFWLGLDNIHALTNSAQMQLRIDLEDAEGQRMWAHYETFHVGDAASKYVLSIGGYTGDAGDGMTDPSEKDLNLNEMKFSTQDNDNDPSGRNCAELYKGGWWFNFCSAAHLNGLPIVGKAPWSEGILWEPFRGWYQSLKKASMKIRPVSLGF